MMSSESPPEPWTPPELKPGRRFWVLMAGSLLFVGALAYFQYARVDRARRAQATPVVNGVPILGHVPDFTLIERSGRKTRLADMRGRIWVADFVFTSCAGPCPIMSLRMADLQRSLARAGLGAVRCVSFSVDPTRDTPEVLRAYADRYHADKYQWLFLTGEKDVVSRLTRKGFKLTLEDETDAEPILHSTRFVLVDGRGRIRGYYEAITGEEIEDLAGAGMNPMPPAVKSKLLSDVRALLREAGR
ncbi:MAG: SCO family protein [Phycisphaerae bacterium]